MKEPLFFGPEGEEVFGWLHGTHGETAVVLANPFGYEAVCAHRSIRHLADDLARAGFPALRFDYPGTFDSSGYPDDTDQVARWLEGLRLAAREVIARTSARRVVLLGVRLGGLLAAKVLAEPGDLPVAGAVLFAPVVKGRAYTRELRAFRLLHGEEHPAAPPRREGSEEAAGYEMRPATVGALGKIDATSLVPTKPVLVLTHTDAERALAEAWRRAGAPCEEVPATGYGEMMLDPHRAHVPTVANAAIVAWLARTFPRAEHAAEHATASPLRRSATFAAPASFVPRVPGEARVREELVRFGPSERLFGILTRPAEGASDRARIVFLNAGAVARPGPNRMHVLLARGWAAAGYTVLRMDTGGLGDSAPAPGALENDTYAKAGIDDAAEGALYLERLPSEGESSGSGPSASYASSPKVVAAGLCSGAYLSFHLAVRGRVGGAFLINPQTFYWKDGMSLDVAPSKAFHQTQHYKSAFTRLETWKKLARGQIDLRHFARTVRSRALHVAEARTERAMARWFPPKRENLRKDLGDILTRGTQLCMFFSAGDPGLDFLDLFLGDQEITRLKKKARLHLEILDGPDHTFTPVWTQPLLYERLTRTLEERFP